MARLWVEKLCAAIRARDARHLITVGLVDWSLPRAGLQSGFERARIAGPLDFISVHLYPREGRLADSSSSGALHFTIRTTSGYAQGLNGPQIVPGEWTHVAITRPSPLAPSRTTPPASQPRSITSANRSSPPTRF